MGHGARKWHQTDREGINYHCHSKLGEVMAIPWRRISKIKSGAYTYLHHSSSSSSDTAVAMAVLVAAMRCTRNN